MVCRLIEFSSCVDFDIVVFVTLVIVGEDTSAGEGLFVSWRV